MKLKKLSLANYRGFEQIDIEFEDDVTVIAGVNGVGKSGILEAIAKILSHSLPQFTYSRAKSLSFEDSDIKVEKTSLTTNATIEIEEASIAFNSLLGSGELPEEQLKEMIKARNDLQLTISNNPKDSKKVSDAKEALKYLDALFDGKANYTSVDVKAHEPEKQMKLLAELKKNPRKDIAVFYTTKRFIHKKIPTLKDRKSNPISSAYSKALEGNEIPLVEFAMWYRAQLALTQNDNSKHILDSLEQAVRHFLPDVKNLSFQESPKPTFILEKNGKKFFHWQLSDGERGLLALVFDLTRRLATANPDSFNPIEEGSAIVMIDEVELHLHPLWQRQVMHRLKETFKSCQFIVTTHSPQVIGETPAESVRLLTSENGVIEVETPGMAFGADSNWILNVLMEAKDKNEDVNNDLEKAAQLISEKDLDGANEIVKALRDLSGNTPAIQRLATLIKRMELLGK